MVVEPKFYSNREDNMHCLQAAVMIVLNTLVGEAKWDEVNAMTEYEKGLYSWTPRAVVAMNEKIKGVKLISGLDYQEFARRGEEYLRGYMSQEWFEDQKQHASKDFKREQRAAKDCVSKNLFEQRVVLSDDIEDWLNNYLLIALVNAKMLSNQQGVAGHLVVVYSHKSDVFLLHDPGLPPHHAWSVPKEKFMSAFKGELILVPKGNVPIGMEVERNDSCPCGSGEKFKKCHGG